MGLSESVSRHNYNIYPGVGANEGALMMCTYGDYVEIEIVRRIKVDSCIADKVRYLNSRGIWTEASCCGHGRCPSSVLIRPSSVVKARELGYKPVYVKDVGLFEIQI